MAVDMNSQSIRLPDGKSIGGDRTIIFSKIVVSRDPLLPSSFPDDRARVTVSRMLRQHSKCLNARRLLGPDVIGSMQSLLGTVVIAVFVITFIVQAFQIPSPSMENTLLVGDYLLVNKLCYGGGGLGDYFMPYRRVQRGDIVVFHYPVNPAQHFVKRVIGVPGDRVRLVNKQVFVNGVPLKEPYAHFTRPANDLFRDNFPRLDVASGRNSGMVAAVAQTGRGWTAHCSRGTLFCDGRQSGR